MNIYFLIPKESCKVRLVWEKWDSVIIDTLYRSPVTDEISRGRMG